MMNEEDEWQQKVLGIALVVEEIGKASKLVFRYPSSPEQISEKEGQTANMFGGANAIGGAYGGRDRTYQYDSNSKARGGSGGRSGGHNDPQKNKNIFSTLPPEVMAKLFRTKPALCKQPMTLSIDSTILCCRSVLLNQSPATFGTSTSSSDAVPDDDLALEESASAQSQSQSQSVIPPALTPQGSGAMARTNTNSDQDGLVQFSIIIAVLPSRRDSKTCTSNRRGQIRRAEVEDVEGGDAEYGDSSTSTSLNYPVVRRIHLSLSRLCAVLEREERRCMYMSRQVSMLLSIGTLTSHINMSTGRDSGKSSDERGFNNKEAEIVEMMIAAKPPLPLSADDKADDDFISRNFRSCIPLKGNLAMELAQFYHACARNDTASISSPASMLSGRDGIVYINHHIAINVEPASERASTFPHNFHLDAIQANEDIPLLRPYHTLLFPHVSATELLRNISSASTEDPSSSYQMDGDLSQRRIQKLLTVCDPFKSLSDMATETALPLTSIIEAAMLLIESGTCIAAPVIQDSTIFACRHDSIQRMSKLKLEFAQQFSHNIPIFVVVSALTTPLPLQHHTEDDKNGADNKNNNGSSEDKYIAFKDVIRYCGMAVGLHVRGILSPDDEDEEGIIEKRENIPIVYRVLANHIISMLYQVATVHVEESFTDGGPQENDIDLNVVNRQNVESILRAMTIWLRSHSVIVELKEYFVAISSTSAAGDHSDETLTRRNGRKSPRDAHCISPSLYEEFEALLSQKFLTGKISSIAFQWKTEISDGRLKALREYGIREKKIQIVTRIPCDGDDWGAP